VLMRIVMVSIFCLLAFQAISQELDSTRKAPRKRIALTKYPKAEAPPKKTSFVIVTSDKKAPSSADPWENEWTNYIEEQSRLIGQKVLARDGDSLKITYKVNIDFSVNEDGAINNLRVSCLPAHNFIMAECTKMAMNAPLKKSQFHKGKYVRMRVSQPVDIKVR
jgi:hypothetical protein